MLGAQALSEQTQAPFEETSHCQSVFLFSEQVIDLWVIMKPSRSSNEQTTFDGRCWRGGGGDPHTHCPLNIRRILLRIYSTIQNMRLNSSTLLELHSSPIQWD